ncbi:hypothetical protein SDC9_61328 [bioreactor metagenome]|uniref:Uncharacterized protein n=1 Tax=bioreactor metagenome TaxID=1076179 RepID=A0A644XLJ2_9ZZZZ
MRLLHKVKQRAVAAEGFVYGVIVRHVVFMVGGRLEHRAEIDHLRAEGFYVVQPFRCSLQVAAVKRAVPGQNVGRNGFGGIVGRFAVIEAVNENLVDDPAFCPFGRGDDVVAVDDGAVEAVALLHVLQKAVARVMERFPL